MLKVCEWLSCVIIFFSGGNFNRKAWNARFYWLREPETASTLVKMENIGTKGAWYWSKSTHSNVLSYSDFVIKTIFVAGVLEKTSDY